MDKILGWHYRGFLPHCDDDTKIQFVTFRLYDSVPLDVIEMWKTELEITEESEKSSAEFLKLQAKIFQYEDAGHGECLLVQKQVYDIVESTLLFYNNSKYQILEYAIMPNHVHVLIKINAGYSLSKIMHSWKSYTTNRIQKLLNRKGKIWMYDYFDRYIRNDEHLEKVIKYIQENLSYIKKESPK